MRHKFVLITTVVGMVLCVGLVIMQMAQGATGTTSVVDDTSMARIQCEFRKYTIDFDEDVNDATVSLPSITGYLDGIVIDSNGTDTSFSVTLRDEHNCNMFVKADCNSVTEPHRYAVTIADSNGVHGAAVAAYAGAPVDGICDVVIADANDATLDDLQVYIYYREYRRIP